MKTRFFIILSLLICSAWNLSLEGMSDDRKNEIIGALDDGNISIVLKDNEINADLGEKNIPLTTSRKINLKNTTPLVYAVHANINNKEATIKWLLSKKDAKLLEKYFISHTSYADKSFKEGLPIDVLINSLEKYHSEIVNWFINNNKPISQYRDKDGNTLLHLLASEDYYLESFKKLYQSDPDHNNLEAINNNGQTPLHIAIALNVQQMPGQKIAQYIIEQPNVDLTKEYKTQEKTRKIEDIIFNRVWINSCNLSELKVSACKNISKLKKTDEPLNNNGDRLIHYLVENNQWLGTMDNFLTKAPLEIINRTNKHGETALHVALDNHGKGKPCEDIIKMLIQSNKFDLTKAYITTNYAKKILFEYPGITHNSTFEELAIKSIIDTKKMNAPLRSFSGDTLFHYLAQNNNLFKNFFSQVEADFKKNINIKNNEGLTPLFYAKDITALKKIIELGADLNATTNNGDTILHHAIRHKNNSLEPSPELLEYLLTNQIVQKLINNKNKQKKTVFDLVIENIKSNPAGCAPYNDHIDVLLQYGAEVGDAIETLNKITNKPPMLNTMISFITTKNAHYKSNPGGSKPAPKPAITNPLTKQLSKLNKKLTNLRKKLKALAANLGTLKSKLGVKK